MGGGEKTARPDGGSEAHSCRAKPSQRPRDAESAGAGRKSADKGRDKKYAHKPSTKAHKGGRRRRRRTLIHTGRSGRQKGARKKGARKRCFPLSGRQRKAPAKRLGAFQPIFGVHAPQAPAQRQGVRSEAENAPDARWRAEAQRGRRV